MQNGLQKVDFFFNFVSKPQSDSEFLTAVYFQKIECVLPIFHLENCPLFSENCTIHYSCRLYCWKFWYCHNLGTNLAAVINLLFHSGISSLLRFWSGHIYSIDTIWWNSLRLLSYHDKMLAIQRIIQKFQCTTQKRFGFKDIQVCLPKIYCYVPTKGQ